MLELTSSAASTLAAARTERGLPEHYGVRIFGNAAANPNGTSSYRFGFVEEPQTNDQVTETDGTRVFVAPEIAPVLENSVLDTHEAGGLVLVSQSSEKK